MVHQYCDGRVPAYRSGSVALKDEQVWERYERLDFAGALSTIWVAIATLNQRIVRQAPWELAKDPARRSELDNFLYDLLEGIRLIATTLEPVMPRAAGRIFAMLGISSADVTLDPAWGQLKPGSRLGTLEPLFPRIEKEKPVSDSAPPPPAAGHATQAAPPAAGDRIDIADFARVELRAARITAAEKVSGSKKLVKLQVDLGDEQRQVVAGIAESYAPEALVGRRVVIVANLKPAKLMGVESNGMLLAASVDGKAVLCTFESDVPAGSKVK
jgi:methionyl-tRNA synthetase